jgi:hypothetical protein
MIALGKTEYLDAHLQKLGEFKSLHGVIGL